MSYIDPFFYLQYTKVSTEGGHSQWKAYYPQQIAFYVHLIEPIS